MKKFYSKKADLSLSVNAIVVLILAIVMLGLILGFIKTMFGKTSNQFDEIISSEKDPEQADMNEPIKLSKGTISLKAKEVGVLKISVYNPGVVDYGELKTPTTVYHEVNNKVEKPEYVIDNTKGCFEGATSYFLQSTDTDVKNRPTQSKQLISSRTSKVVGLSFKTRDVGDFVCAICTRRIGGDKYGNPADGTETVSTSMYYGDVVTPANKFWSLGEQYCTSLRVIVKP